MINDSDAKQCPKRLESYYSLFDDAMNQKKKRDIVDVG